MAEKEVKESGNFVYWVLPQIINTVLSAGICCFIFYFNAKSTGFFIQSLVITLGMNVLTGVAVRRFFPVSVSVYADNRKRLSGYWISYGCGLMLALSCVYMPDAVWPFTGIFTLLSLFGGAFTGCIGGLSLLVTAVILTGENIGVLIIYMICGLLAAALTVSAAGNKERFVSWAVSLIALFAFILFGIAVSSPDSISAYSFIFPLINVFLSGIIMFAGFRFYYDGMIAVNEDKYQVLNDIAYPVLADEKEKDYNNYLIAIHTSYFCERIAIKLGLDEKAMKCVGYYYRFCPTGEENRNSFFLENAFPQKASDILEEYTDFISKRSKGKVFSKECVALVSAQTVVVTSLAMHSKNTDIKIGEQIDRIVDATFERYEKAGTFENSNITFKELQTVKELFKGEKLYYDFLCGK